LLGVSASLGEGLSTDSRVKLKWSWGYSHMGILKDIVHPLDAQLAAKEPKVADHRLHFATLLCIFENLF